MVNAPAIWPSRGRRLLAGTLLALVATLIVLLGSPRPAQAHDSCVGVYYGGVQRGVACLRDGHRMLDGCDRHSDGLRTRAWYWYGGIVEPSYWDPNGADSGCAHQYFPATISGYRICVEQPVGCSAWQNP